MDLSSGFRIGRVRGIDIRMHWSWLLIFALLSWSLSQSLFVGGSFDRWPAGVRWGAGVGTALLFFGSVLLHELSHAFVAQRYGMQVPSITLFVFGGVSTLAQEMSTAGQEFRVAIAGPLTSWALSLTFGALWLLTRSHDLSEIFVYLAAINAALGAFNLLPGFPLDGGRVFRSIVWARSKDLLGATRTASRLGVAIAYAMIALGLLNVLLFGLLGGLWYVLIGLFLKSASEGSYGSMLVESALKNVSARAAMRPSPEPVAAALSLERFVDERLLTTGQRAFLVERAGAVVGIITASDVVKLPREQWRATAVEAAMVPSERVLTVGPETSVVEALRMMQQHDVHQLPVIENGLVIGLLTRGDVMQQIELRTVFGEHERRRGRERRG
ncbi:MAG: site-2 protease family protein [Dehalococcoidia bacterium]|nr:site-2 protease family protein [Dehalococcoidia bacterium]